MPGRRVSELRKLLEEGGVEGEVARDVLRALIVFGGSLWASELEDAVNRVKLGRVEYAWDRKTVEKVLKKLQGIGVVSVEKRVRASDKAGGEKDSLIRLVSGEARQILGSDRVLNEYFASTLRSLREKEG